MYVKYELVSIATNKETNKTKRTENDTIILAFT